MIVLLFIFGFVAAGLAIWLAALTSPSGYQDEKGFHYGTQPKPVPKRPARKPATRIRNHSTAVAAAVKTERRNPRSKKAVAEWETPDPLADQLKFPFPATH